MRKEYDFSRGRPNPYARRLKRSVTIRLDERTIAYFQQLSTELDVPYQTLINLYLRDCAETGRKPAMRWRPAPREGRSLTNTIDRPTER
jgi:antitoxin component of RelBE/YafQ-DinJ toxin-antitoxin module